MLKNISRYYWWCQLSGWLFWMILNIVMANYYGWHMDASYFINQSSMVIIGIGITHSLRGIILNYNFLEYPVKKLLLRLPIIIVICALLLTLIRGIILINIYPDNERFRLFSMWRLISSSLLITTWILIYFIGHYFQKEQQFQIDKLQLEAMVKDLELRTLKSQLNPHFLFNSLNSIRALVDENPERARTAVTELSNILRGSMQIEEMEKVSTRKEMNLIKDYLALEHIRFEERLKVNYHIDENTLDLSIPPMMLQTLVENAIKHGISHTVSGGYLEIISRISEIYHEIIIRNTGQLLEKPEHKGFGIKSTRQRLKLLYKNKATFAIHNFDKKMVEARIKIPL